MVLVQAAPSGTEPSGCDTLSLEQVPGHATVRSQIKLFEHSAPFVQAWPALALPVRAPHAWSASVSEGTESWSPKLQGSCSSRSWQA